MMFRIKTGKISLFFTVVALLSLLVWAACTKPFRDVSVILSNSYIAHTISVSLLDAKTGMSLSTGTTATLSGDAVNRGLLYTADGGTLSTNTALPLVEGRLNLAIKPLTTISPQSPLRFTLEVSATGYLGTRRDIVVGATDSLQFVALELVSLANPPAGISVAQKLVTGLSNGNITSDAAIIVGPASAPAGATLALAANTTLLDAGGNRIASNAPLQVITQLYEPGNNAAFETIPGGLSNLTDAQGQAFSLLPAAAIDINMQLGNIAVKSFSQPLSLTLPLDANCFNPATGRTIAAGDVLELYSNSAGKSGWQKEGTAVVASVGGKLQATLSISHLSVWTLAFSIKGCATDLNITYNSEVPGVAVRYIEASLVATGQVVATKTARVSDGDVVALKLPEGVDIRIKVYDGSSSGALLDNVVVPACGTTTGVRIKVDKSLPVLNFDLITRCTDGEFRYTGPIDYRLGNSTIWMPFSPAKDGKVTTNLLKWDQVYYFRIIYKGATYTSPKLVSKTEFRQVGGADTWDYWGKDPAVQRTFIAVPSPCR